MNYISGLNGQMGHLAFVICKTWHLDGLKLMSHHFSHISRI